MKALFDAIDALPSETVIAVCGVLLLALAASERIFWRTRRDA